MIYCVEDDDSIRELMLYALRASGFEAEGFRDSVGLFDALSHAQPQLIMLDIMLPGMDGIEILKASGAIPPPPTSRSSSRPPGERSTTRWWGWTWARTIIWPSPSA